MEPFPVRVRFAPSPTGFLHVGGARTALFNWLFARHHGGVFVLRIEDTDKARSSAEMTDAILDGLRWLGTGWDEGPHHQADGLERHRADAMRMLGTGDTYRCFCRPGDLEARRTAAGGDPRETRYDRHCLQVPAADSAARAEAGEPFALRFRVPEGRTAWEDAVYGPIEFANADIEDFVVLRTDGTPIYNMAVVSDDASMRITHVIRGDDHVSNTPKQILIYRALGAPLPVFAHVPMILGPDGKRLSKRHGATAIGEYRSEGILAGAMVNFLALLGWSPGTDEELFTPDQLVARFTLAGVNRKSAVFDFRKLWWLNGQHLSRTPAAELLPLVAPRLAARGLLADHSPGTRAVWLGALIDLLKARARTVDDIADRAAPYLDDAFAWEADAVATHWADPPATADRLAALRRAFAGVPAWSEPALDQALRECAGSLGIGAGKLIHPLRVALVGSTVSPGIFEVAALLGRERVLARIDRALDHLSPAAG